MFRTTRQKRNSSLSILGVTLVGVSIAAIIFLPDNSPKWMLSTESNKTTLQEHKNLILVSCLRGALPPVDFLAVLSALYILKCVVISITYIHLLSLEACYVKFLPNNKNFLNCSTLKKTPLHFKKHPYILKNFY